MADRRALVISQDRYLQDDIDRLAAAAGCGLDRADGVPAARRVWASAPLVLLDPAAVEDCSVAGLSRRRGVLALCRGEPPPALWRRCIELGVEEVLSLPAAQARLVGVLADVVQGGTRRGRSIAVIGGRGGAGASVFAAALALVALRRRQRALLVDCDPLGGGTDYLLGLEQAAGLRWPQLGLAGGRVAASSLHAALPAVPAGAGRLTVLSCGREGEPPSADAVASVVEAGLRGGDTVVCDLPRHLPDPAIAAVDRAGLVVLVLPAEVRACSAALPVARCLLARGAPARLVVRGPAPGGLAPVDLSRALGLPLLATMRPAPGLAAALDTGRLPFRSARNPLARAAATVLDAVPGAGSAGGAP